MLAALVAKVLGKARPAYGDGSFTPYMSPRGDLATALGLPLKSELVRMGDTWSCSIATGSAFTYVNALPTTRAELVLFNGESASGKSYVIDSAWMFNVSSMAAAQPITLVGQLALTGIAAPTDDANQLIYSRSGRRSYAGQAKRAVANTAFCIANKWEVIASANDPMTTNLGQGLYADLFGGWIVPPGGALGLAGVAGTAAGTAVIGVTWHEVLLPVVG